MCVSAHEQDKCPSEFTTNHHRAFNKEGSKSVHYALNTCIQRIQILIVYKTYLFVFLPASSCTAPPWPPPCTSRSRRPGAARAPPPGRGRAWPRPWCPWCPCRGACQAGDVGVVATLSGPCICSSLPLPDIAGMPVNSKQFSKQGVN